MLGCVDTFYTNIGYICNVLSLQCVKMVNSGHEIMDSVRFLYLLFTYCAEECNHMQRI